MRKSVQPRTRSLIIAVAAYAFISVFIYFLYENSIEEAKLESRNDMERSMSLLLASLRDHADFGAAIKDDSRLDAKIRGVAVYASSGKRLYAYGEAPLTFINNSKLETDAESRARGYIEKPTSNSIVLLLTPMKAEPPFAAPGADHPGPGGPDGPARAGRPGSGPEGPSSGPDQGKGPPPLPPESPCSDSGTMGEARAESLISHAPAVSDSGQNFRINVLQKGTIIYLEIRASAYWAKRRALDVIFPLVEISLATVIFIMRDLILRNLEYRAQLKEQQNLVVLGTAASTIAHDMKNPLLAIRLQTSILERTCPEGKTEISNINDEVDRLSALCYRVNDYLRDPRGKPEQIDLVRFARETGIRFLGSDILKTQLGAQSQALVLIDPARLASIVENLLRNALESGSPHEAIGMQLSKTGSSYSLDVLDHGSGIPKEDREKLFDPFFTTKSKGTGIGLSVCRRFVQAAGGSISLADREGGGTRARIVLPAAPAGAARPDKTGDNAGKSGDIHNTDNSVTGGF